VARSAGWGGATDELLGKLRNHVSAQKLRDAKAFNTAQAA
jgi:hypothetical protein